jgi:predicted RNA-binding Zn ribbon-like protein
MQADTDRAEPGDREPAPGAALRLLQEFVNTNDIEGGTDALETPERLHDWLADRKLASLAERTTIDEVRRTLEVREGLRALARANNGETLDRDRLAALNRSANGIQVVIGLQPDDWSLQPAGRGVDEFLGIILATVARSMADGSWSRIKACRNDACRWLFYDHSRNRSGTWCTMAICGNRMKSRSYRTRRRGAVAGG